MFTYTSDFSSLAHHIITEFVHTKNLAIDATLGNGFDTDFLSKYFNFVYSFDIQREACDRYAKKTLHNVQIINDSHHMYKNYINEGVDCIIYNLGFLPGGDKTITTEGNTSLESIKIGLELLNNNGFMFISVYRGHPAGALESDLIEEYIINLPKKIYGVMEHKVINRSTASPILYVIEKK